MRFSIPAKGGPLAHPLECDSCQSSGATANHERTVICRNEVGLAAQYDPLGFGFLTLNDNDFPFSHAYDL